MPCFQRNAPGYAAVQAASTGPFTTEADCLQACKEGACCNGETCTVRPQCKCNAANGEVFQGVGTVCAPNPCNPLP